MINAPRGNIQRPSTSIPHINPLRMNQNGQVNNAEDLVIQGSKANVNYSHGPEPVCGYLIIVLIFTIVRQNTEWLSSGTLAT